MIAFRCDASVSIGSGHVMRCLSLAEAVRADGGFPVFVCRPLPGDMIRVIEDRGFPVLRLGDRSRDGSGPEVPSVEADAEETAATLSTLGSRPRWLVVDHYELGEAWEARLRRAADRIMVIEDRGNQVHDCDLLLDQNLVREMGSRYLGKVPPSCALLLGPKFALLHPLYARLHDRIPEREGRIERILVFFSGADSANMTGLALAALLRLERQDVMIDVVISRGHAFAAAILKQIEGRPNVFLHTDLPTLAPLIAQADLAIGAAGTATWERLCLGLPAVVISLAENQEPAAEYLHHLGLVEWLGRSGDVAESTVLSAVFRHVEAGLPPEWSKRCALVVDGSGARRVSSIMSTDDQSALFARHATVLDEALLLELANDPLVRNSAFATDAIRPEDHKRWFRKRLRDFESTKMIIVENAAGVAVGQVRLDRTSSAWELDYSIAASFRGRKLGVRLLHAAFEFVRQELLHVRVLARVKPGNTASRRVLERFGFQQTRVADHLEFHCVL